MLHADLAYQLPIPTELDKLNYLVKAHIKDRKFGVSNISTEAQKELQTLGYKVVYREIYNQYQVSW